MEIHFTISGSVVFKTTANVVPSVGSEVTICTSSYRKGMWPGTILNFRVSEEFPPHFDYTADSVYIDVNGWTVFKDGPAPEGE